MFKPVSAKEERLLPVYVYGSESLEHQAQISRGKGFMLHSQISVCYSGEGVFTDHNNVSHKVQSGDIDATICTVWFRLLSSSRT